MKERKNTPRSERVEGAATIKVGQFSTRTHLRTRSYSTNQGAQRCKPSAWCRTERQIESVYSNLPKQAAKYDKAARAKDQRESRRAKRKAKKS